MLQKPVVAISDDTTVKNLLKYFSDGFLSLEEFSDALNTKVVWDYRGIVNSDPEWVGENTWAVLYESIGKELTSSDYMFLAQKFEEGEHQKWMLSM